MSVTVPRPATLLLASVMLILLSIASACGPARTGSAKGDTRSATIHDTGSDTMVNLALAWAEAYRTERPEVQIAVTGGGSGTGIAALINGTVQIANASRPMNSKEIDEAKANGIDPVARAVAIDALAVIVNLQNSISRLTIAQLSDIYAGRITNWSALGGPDTPVVLVSRETNSGTHVYFLEQVVRRGEKENKDIFAPQTLLMPSSVGITSEVRRNPNAIGYDGLGYVTADEKLVAVAKTPGDPFILPSVDSAADGSYALSRPLFMITAGQPQGEIARYLEWILGPEGQAIVREQGFVPLTAAEAPGASTVGPNG